MTYPDGKKARITYSANKPIAVVLLDADESAVYKAAYAFSGDRLVSVTEYGVENGAFVQGAQSTYAYSAGSRRTVVTTSEPADAEEGEAGENTLTTTYAFDDDGSVVSEYVYTADTGSMGGDGEESGINPHSGDGGAGVVGNSHNLLVGHNFETLEQWTGEAANAEDFSVSNYAYEPYAQYGRRVLRMQSYSAAAADNGVYQSSILLPKGEYTFSAYVRVLSGNITGGETPGAYVRVTAANGAVLAESERISRYDGEYTRLIAPFVLDAEQTVKVHILMSGKGTAYADAAQLEKNPFANAYNLLENGNFEHGTEGWTTTEGVSASDGTRFNMRKSLCMAGRVDAARNAYQAAAVRTARSTRESYTLSGWAKGYGVAARTREGCPDAQFRLRAVVKYYDTAYREYGSEEYTADFSPCTEEWQFASVRFAKEKYRTIAYVRVYCDYGYNAGTVCFDDVQLVRSSIETGLSASDFVVESTGGADDAEAPAAMSCILYIDRFAAPFRAALQKHRFRWWLWRCAEKHCGRYSENPSVKRGRYFGANRWTDWQYNAVKAHAERKDVCFPERLFCENKHCETRREQMQTNRQDTQRGPKGRVSTFFVKKSAVLFYFREKCAIIQN